MFCEDVLMCVYVQECLCCTDDSVGVWKDVKLFVPFNCDAILSPAAYASLYLCVCVFVSYYYYILSSCTFCCIHVFVPFGAATLYFCVSLYLFNFLLVSSYVSHCICLRYHMYAIVFLCVFIYISLCFWDAFGRSFSICTLIYFAAFHQRYLLMYSYAHM